MIEIHDAVPPLVREWDDLADALRATPFHRPGWLEAWWRAFGRGSLQIVVERREGRMCGVLPLRRVRGGTSSPTNDHTPRFGTLAETEATAAELWRAVFASRPRRVLADFVDTASFDLNELAHAAGDYGFRVRAETSERPPYLDIVGSWEQYEAGLDAKLRHDLARRRRRLEAEGDVSVQVADGVERLAELLDEGFAVEGSGWKDARGTAIASRPATQAFYAELARWAAARGSLRLAFLRLDGRAVAFQYGLEEAGAYYFVKGGYDPGLRRFAPGKLLVQEMVRRAFAGGLVRFDFLGGDDPFKLEWTRTRGELKRVRAFPASMLGIAAWGADAYGRPVARWALRLARGLNRESSTRAGPSGYGS